MNDLYKEILVGHKKPLLVPLRKAGMIALTVIFVFAGLLMNPIFLLAAIAAGIGCYFMFNRFEKEYEYLYVSGDFDVDIIYNKMKRKRKGAYPVETLVVFAPEKSSHLDGYMSKQGITVVDYTSHLNLAKIWCGVYSTEKGEVLVKFEFDDDELVADLRRKAPQKVFTM